MLNPIHEARVSHGLSRLRLAALARCPYQAVYAAERGLPLRPHGGILKALETLGYKAEDVLTSYRQFRETNAGFER